MIAWYLCPYKRREHRRYCAMDDLTPDIGPYWYEKAVGDHAVVAIMEYTKIGRAFKRLSETEAAALTDINPLAKMVSEAPQSLEHRQILAEWRGVGFGRGFRLPKRLTSYLARRGIEPDRWRRLLAPLFDQAGAFPTNSTLLDNFNRADESPIGGIWTNNITSVDNVMVINANQMQGPAGTDWGSAWLNNATYGPDVEFYALLAIEGTGGGNELWLRIIDPNTGTEDAYLVHSGTGVPNFELYKAVNHTQTQLGASGSQSMADGDSFGIDAIGTSISGYYKAGAGSWSQVLTRIDSAITTAGYVGVAINGASARIDNVSGGTVVSASLQRLPSAGWIST